jgi:hypothetical protein
MPITTSPHEWKPLRWWDRLLRGEGRCRFCIAPRIAHPMPAWFTARPLSDARYYDNHEAHDIYHDEHFPDEQSRSDSGK